ncbi:CPBP family intramembrane glutamic endopeptidase [Furfurilactobacillus curtus]|uniref:CAAX prenyl protease 2/Lysostaphin resistance protein A-like domain-containing protein n=1 Tax=Furfurilactobacillus curtus TaxID=1746200 RepID=A0ABQ5JQL9_9LACO
MRKIWRRQDVYLMGLMTGEVLLGLVLEHALVNEKVALTIIGALIAIFVFANVIWFKRSLLATDWHRLKQQRGQAMIGVVVVLIGFAVSQWLASTLVPGAAAAQSPIVIRMASIIGFVTAVLAPFTEEVIFRYELFFQFRRQSRIVQVLMALISAGLFGTVHAISGDGLSSIISLAIVGLVLVGVYAWTKNIWISLLGHLVWNVALALPLLISLFLPVA